MRLTRLEKLGVVVFVLMFLCACKSGLESYKCKRDIDVLRSLDDCLEHPQCRLTGNEFHAARQLRRNIPHYCGLNSYD